VRSAAEFRALVAQSDLGEAYQHTDVVVAANAEFTDQASLHLSLGPADPPIRLRDPVLGGVGGLASGSGGDLLLPIGGAARVLADLLAGEAVDFGAAGEATPLQPRRELHTRLDLEAIGGGQLLLHRGIVENGLVAVSSAPGLIRTPWGPLLGPYGNALYSCSGADSIGLAMPGLAMLGPGSPVLVGGAIGWVVGSGSGHQPAPRRLPSGHARGPGAVAALSVDLHGLSPRWVRACHFEGHGSALLVAIAAPIPLISPAVARQIATDDGALEAPVLDFSIPRRIRPGFGTVSYGELLAGRIQVDGHRLRAAPACSLHLGDSLAEDLLKALENGSFPITDHGPLDSSGRLHPLD